MSQTGCSTSSQARGFTLIELIMVLIIISITMAMAAPSMRGWSDGAKLRDAGDMFIASARWARGRAILTGQAHVLQIDSSSGAYRIGQADPAEANASIAPVAGVFGQQTELPQSFDLSLLSGGGPGGTIVFYPNGRCTPAVVRLTSARGKTADIAAAFPADPFRLVIAQ